MAADPDSRARALALLEHNHDFPCDYSFRAVVRTGHRPAVVTAVRSAAPEVVGVSERPSRHGTYVSLRIQVTATSAEHVLEVYDVLRQVEGVLLTL